MSEAVSDFLKALAALAGVAAVIGLGVATQRYWLIPLLLGAAVVFPVARILNRRIGQVLVRSRGYASLEGRLAEARGRIQELEDRLGQAAEERVGTYRAGIEEGRAQVFGAVLAAGGDPAPELTSVTMKASHLLLVGSRRAGADIPVGARFTIVVRGSGEVKGVVEVVEVNDETLLFACVDRLVAAFWDRIEASASSDASPPSGVMLRPYKLDDPTETVSPGLAQDVPEEAGQ